LAEDVRHAFAFRAARVPERAQRYLGAVLKRRNPEQTIRDIMWVRGSLAQAAPAELVELTLAGLVAKADEEEPRHRRSIRDEILTHLNADFLPSSPAKGPFLDCSTPRPSMGSP
jgi:hypothetical protein